MPRCIDVESRRKVPIFLNVIFDFILGRPLASNEDAGQRIDALRGVSMFGLDALSSAPYGPEAALTILLPVGLAGLPYILPISAAIIALLIVVYFSLSANHRRISEGRRLLYGSPRKPRCEARSGGSRRSID